MFTFQTTRKRGRDDDSDSDFDEQRYFKKSRPVLDQQTNHGHVQHPSPANRPHRPTLTPSPPRLFTDLGSMTPAHSEYGGADSPQSIYGGPVLQSRESSNIDMDMDMEEDDFDVRSQPPESPAFTNFMRPAMLKPSVLSSDTANDTGRIPTPIHPTFKRTGMNGLAYPMSGSAGGVNTNNGHLGIPVSSLHAQPAWKGPRKDMEDDRSRRMPSPISEDDDVPDTPTALTQSRLSRLSVSQPDQMDAESTSALAPPPTPRGRKRSGALTGMGRFSMGYRDDCDKCRQRVPGHYSHFLS